MMIMGTVQQGFVFWVLGIGVPSCLAAACPWWLSSFPRWKELQSDPKRPAALRISSEGTELRISQDVLGKPCMRLALSISWYFC